MARIKNTWNKQTWILNHRLYNVSADIYVSPAIWQMHFMGSLLAHHPHLCLLPLLIHTVNLMHVTGDVTSDERKNRTSQLQTGGEKQKGREGEAETNEPLSQWSCSLNTFTHTGICSQCLLTKQMYYAFLWLLFTIKSCLQSKSNKSRWNSPSKSLDSALR